MSTQKPYIAKDTGEPLVVLGGYQVASDGGLIRQDVQPSSLPQASDADKLLLRRHGELGLRALEYHGILDRLFNSGIIESR